MYQPLENYGMIGNMRTAAMISTQGSIDWYCYPHFDSPSIFGAILDDKKGGCFSIGPSIHANEKWKTKQFYWPSTNILITRFLLDGGIGELEDFMPVGMGPESPDYRKLFRRVRCVKGSVLISMRLKPAFNYGRTRHRVQINEKGALFSTPELRMFLTSKVSLEADEGGGVHAEFKLSEGESLVFIFSEVETEEIDSHILKGPSIAEAEKSFQDTVKYWRNWISKCTYRGRWREQVQRSALALKLLTFEPTGAIVAAPTASLPEVIGGTRNWDYRYTWLRDAAFTVYAFLRIGFHEEALGFMKFINTFVRPKGDVDKMEIGPLRALYTINGGTEIPEIILDHWEGYRGSGPVRIGNEAVTQYQMDIYGELLDSTYLYNKYVNPISFDQWVSIRKRLDWICENWDQPDAGIWEMRNRKEDFTFSKVMNWVALDRGLRLADKRAFPAHREKWIRERDRIYEQIMQKAWNEKRQAFTQYYGSEDLDASLLIMPMVFFMAPNDPRMLSTLRAIAKPPIDDGLLTDGLVFRYPLQKKIDGLPGEEGTFNMCSFWLAEALTRAGQTEPEFLDGGRLLFERMLGYANHLGLYGEQTGAQGEALGNFPQAFTHLALISAAFSLDRVLSEKAG